MKYIIMCGGNYTHWMMPRQMVWIGKERVVQRTIRLLRESGVDDIAISSNNNIFAQFGVPVLKHQNIYTESGYNISSGYWCNAFYPSDEPTCYLMGDVVFSPEAIRTIVKKKTKDVEFFASAPPFDERFKKIWAEPFAFKVINQDHFKESIAKCKRLQDEGAFNRKPIAWELWQVIKDTPLNEIDYTNYTVINDYTCDIDELKDIEFYRDLGE